MICHIFKKQPLTECMYWKHLCRKSLKGGVDTLQKEVFFQPLGSTPGLSPGMETPSWFHSCF